MNFDKIKAVVVENAALYLPKVALALVALVVGLFIINAITSGAGRVMKKRGLDDTLQPFLKSLISWILKAALVVAILTTVGIQATSFVAILGAAGLAVGMALQGSLGNFAGGVLLMIFRPFQVGDLIEAQGVTGVVKELQIFATTLITPENKTVTVPNGKLSAETITNFTTQGTLRVDLQVGIDYGEDIRQAREVIMGVMNKNDKILKSPAATVNVLELGDNAVNLAVRPHCDVANYWDVYFGTYEEVKIALDEAKISMPFPQCDVHLHQAG